VLVLRLRPRRKQIPLCVPRPPNHGGKEKARDFVRDDTLTRRRYGLLQSLSRTLAALVPERSSQVLLLDLGHGVWAGEDCIEHFVFAQPDVFEQIGLHQQDRLHADHFQDG
jgi:hypothetical protein